MNLFRFILFFIMLIYYLKIYISYIKYIYIYNNLTIKFLNINHIIFKYKLK